MRMTSAAAASVFLGLSVLPAVAIDAEVQDEQWLTMPAPGFHELRVLTPRLVELTLITTKKPDPARLEQWDFMGAKGGAHLPEAGAFLVFADTETNKVSSVGFKRRVLYAPFKQRDLRIGNYLYLELGKALEPGQTVRVVNP